MHMIQLPIIILIIALASNNLALGAPASYSSSRRPTASHKFYQHILDNIVRRQDITEQGLYGRGEVAMTKIGASSIAKDDHRPEQRDIEELYEREPWSLGGLWRGAKKAVGTVQKIIGTVKNYAGTAQQIGKMAGFGREFEEVSEREYHDELYDRELDSHHFEREYDEELVRDFNGANMDGLD